VKEVLAPAAMERGADTPLTENPVPVAETEDTVKVPVPVFDMVTVWSLALPTGISEYDTVVGATWSDGVATAEPELPEPVDDPDPDDELPFEEEVLPFDEPVVELFEVNGLVPPRLVNPRQPESPRERTTSDRKPMKNKGLLVAKGWATDFFRVAEAPFGFRFGAFMARVG
jgi:hypothetical protein